MLIKFFYPIKLLRDYRKVTTKSQRLAIEIIELSDSPTWDLAKMEWQLSEIYFADDPETCLCGHYPILELCIINNIKNSNMATVGNCCVKKFLGLPSDKIFAAIKRVKKDIEKSVNSETLKHAFRKEWISKWEYDFYNNIGSKRLLTNKQNEKKIEVNRRILKNMSKNK